ncbi:MAG TPA: glycosyltransferase family 1 protein [Puia sp.]|nr:glycosyltransferase family 1 protein [Puia sp.]
MKVLFDHQIFTTQKFGGISRYFNEIMKIQDASFDVDKIDPELIPLPDPELVNPGLVSRGIQFAKRKIGIKEKDVKPVLPEEIVNKLKGGAFDIFHPTYFDPYFVEYVRKPFVLTVYDMVHEIYTELFTLADGTSNNKKLLCDKAESIITISHTTKRDLVNILKISEEKVHAIPLASDFDKVVATAPAQISGIDNFILFTGARWTYKNFYFTAIALADILKQDKTLQLLCTGHAFTDSELQFFENLGIGSQVKHIFLKNDSELAWAYQNARVFIFPSLYEGFGFPLLEAFASDCPVVSSRGGSLLEVGGEGALFFDPKNFTGIQDATVKALYDSELRKEMIKKGRIQFQQYSWEKCRSATLEVYKSILQ